MQCVSLLVRTITMFGVELDTIIKDCQLKRIPEALATELAHVANDISIWVNVRDVFPYPYTVDHAESFIRSSEEEIGSLIWGIYLEDKMAGVIGLHLQSDVHRFKAELGYWLGTDFRGRGLAYASVATVVDYAFSQTNLIRIYSSVFEDNKASAKVLISNGFLQEGILRKSAFKNGRFVDEIVFARLKN